MANTPESPVAKLELELRRGALVLAVLTQLRQMQYGIRCGKPWPSAACRSRKAPSTVLRRLEGQGCWLRMEDRKRPPRRYYRLNDAGEALLAELIATWNALVGTMAGLLEGNPT